MRVLVTGSRGYIGSVMVPLIVAEGHQVTGLDTDFYEQCTFGAWKDPFTRSGRMSGKSPSRISEGI